MHVNREVTSLLATFANMMHWRCLRPSVDLQAKHQQYSLKRVAMTVGSTCSKGPGKKSIKVHVFHEAKAPCHPSN